MPKHISPSRETGKLNNIQLLRALAAVCVLLCHTGLAIPPTRGFGSFGVDIFFVISGFIMCRVIDRTPAYFFRRRALRIVPPYWCFTFLTFALGIFTPQVFGKTHSTLSALLKSLFFIPFAKTVPYFGHLVEPLLGLGWTLNLEMFFYLVLSLALLVNRRRAILIAGLAIVVTVLLSRAIGPRTVYTEFYGRTVMLEFVFGLIAYRLTAMVPAHVARRLRLPLFAVAILSFALLIFFEGVWPRANTFWTTGFLFLGLPAFALVTSTVLLSIGGFDLHKGVWTKIGDSSYILYLIQFFSVLGIDRLLGPRWPFLRTSTWSGATVALLASLLTAVILHTYVEAPVLAWLVGRFGGRRRPTEFANEMPVVLPS
jgi:exopolysaccharide production protein ExoZ